MDTTERIFGKSYQGAGTRLFLCVACASCLLSSSSSAARPINDIYDINISTIEQNVESAKNLIKDATEISLIDAANQALINNPLLKTYESLVMAKAWELEASKRRWFPSFSALSSQGAPLLGELFNTTTAEYPNSSGSSDFATSTYNSSYYQYSSYLDGNITADLKWEFYEPTRQPLIQSAKNKFEVSQLQTIIKARDILLAVQLAYNSAIETERLIGIYEELCKINKQEYVILRAQLRSGLIDVGSVSQQASMWLNQVSTLNNLYKANIDFASALASAIGLDPGSVILPQAKHTLNQQIKVEAWKQSLEESINLALTNREEIQAENKDAAAAEWEAIRLKNKYLPIVSLGGTVTYSRLKGYYEAPVGTDASPYYSTQSSTNATIGLGLEWKLFDGGVNYAKAKAAKAVSQSHEEMALAYELSIGEEVRKSYSARQIAALTIPSNELALQKAKESLEVARQRFETGIGNITTIVQANALVGEAAHQLINNRLNYKNADAQLYRYTATWPSFVSKTSLANIATEQ